MIQHKLICLLVLSCAFAAAAAATAAPTRLSVNLLNKISIGEIQADTSGVSFASPQAISSYTLQIGDSLSSSLSRGIFITNTPGERLQVIRCGQDTPSQQQAQFDIQFGQSFESLFQKTNFTFQIGETAQQPGTTCFGLNILYRRGFSNIIDATSIEQQLNGSLRKLFTGLPSLFLELSLLTPFDIEESVSKQGSMVRVIVSLIKPIPLTDSLPSLISLRINQIFQVEAGKLTQISTAKSENQVGYFKKTAGGAGLHQTSSIDLNVEIKQHAFDQSKPCRLVIVDYTDNTQYVDKDELILHPNLDMVNIRVHDIEKPSGQSGQHVYFLSYTLSEKDIQASNDSVLLHVNDSYLFHYRYRTPFEGLYKSSYMNSQPHFFLSCLKEESHAQHPLTSSVIERAVQQYYPNETFTRVNVTPLQDGEDTLERQIPVGNIGEKTLTFQVTIALTVLACIFLAVQMHLLAGRKQF